MEKLDPRRLAKLIREAPDRKKITIRDLAKKMGGVSSNYLCRMINPDDDGAKLGVEDFVYLLAVTDLEPLDYIELVLGRVAVPEPGPTGTSRRKWHELYATAAVKVAKAQGALALALKDGEVDTDGATKLIKELNEAIAILMEIKHRARAVLDG